MSWLLASLLLLGLALVAGFAWWERSRPSARLIALVAALAALAVLGRIAFAPVPNVKPTTDIVLFAGYALGGAPGFMVGAVAALASNLFFGQGPWTPWQMAAWGGVGIAGAGLARVAGRRVLGRWTLAAACGLAGLAFGAVMNVSLWLTYTGEPTLAGLGVIAAGSLPFDLAHATGNAAFALAFGPALTAALGRFRLRLEVTWKPAVPAAPVASACLVLVACAGALAFAPAPAHAAAPVQSVRWLERAQNADGGFGGAPGQRSTALHTGWAALGLAATGRHPADVARRTDVLAYVRAHAGELSDLGEIERTLLVLGAAGASPRSFAGRDLLGELLRRRRRDGSFGGQVNTTAFAVLALRAVGRSPRDATVRRAASWIRGQANPDGGWNFAGRGASSGIDDTGAALQALAAGGRRRGAAARRGAAFLARGQNADGGFPLQPGGSSNAQSTAWAVQGLLAVGREPERLRRRGGRSPLGYLRSLVSPSGAIRYSRTSAQTPVWVTAQALTALARRPFPLERVRRRGSGAGTHGGGGVAGGGGGGGRRVGWGADGRFARWAESRRAARRPPACRDCRAPDRARATGRHRRLPSPLRDDSSRRSRRRRPRPRGGKRDAASRRRRVPAPWGAAPPPGSPRPGGAAARPAHGLAPAPRGLTGACGGHTFANASAGARRRLTRPCPASPPDPSRSPSPPLSWPASAAQPRPSPTRSRPAPRSTRSRARAPPPRAWARP